MKRSTAFLIAGILAIPCLGITGCAPEPPLKVTFRQSVLDSDGLVLQVQNTSGKYLSCCMHAKNSLHSQSTSYAFDVGPHKTEEIGLFETSWTFKTGEKVTIEVEGHSSKSLTVP